MSICPPCPSNRKLENQAKHKQMLAALHNFQEKIDEVASNELMNDEGYRQLCETNKELFNKFKTLFDEITTMKQLWLDTIVNNAWTTQYTQGDYHADQRKTREYKINNPDYQLCPCGDWISKYRVRTNSAGETIRSKDPRAMIDHQKREKCMSNRARLKWEADKKVKLSKVIKIDTYLLMNSHINQMANGKTNPNNGYGYYCLGQLIKRWKIYHL
tara:strand:- start:1728 stop:2372 length:645 start_codon:yes stop_codon:yes gene_type:complete